MAEELCSKANLQRRLNEFPKKEHTIFVVPDHGARRKWFPLQENTRGFK